MYPAPTVAVLVVPAAGVIVGPVPNTSEPEPVSSVTADAKFALEGVPKNVVIPVPNEVMPVPPFATGSVPVTAVVNEMFVIVLLEPFIVLLVKVAAASSAVIVRTVEPSPTSSWKLTLSHATRPAVVDVVDERVRVGVAMTGEVPKTKDPDPVSSVTAASKFADEGVPKKVAMPEPKEEIPVPPLATGRMLEPPTLS